MIFFSKVVSNKIKLYKIFKKNWIYQHYKKNINIWNFIVSFYNKIQKQEETNEKNDEIYVIMWERVRID